MLVIFMYQCVGINHDLQWIAVHVHNMGHIYIYIYILCTYAYKLEELL